MNRCSLGFLKKNILRSATDAEITFGIMTSSDEEGHQSTQVAKDLAVRETNPVPAAKGRAKLETTKPTGPNSASPQEVIQHFKPQAGLATAANATRLPDKIMAILLNEEAPEAIWWLQKGTAFAMQKEKFQTEVLDKHFRGNKFKSLVRNLHRWGFKRMTCDTTPAGKTIAFSHKHFRQDKPELVQLIQITKEKDVGDAVRERREALRAAMPSATSPPSALRFSGPRAGPLREEGIRATQGNMGLLFSGSPSLPHPQSHQPSIANLVAAEHNQNLTAHTPNSFVQSLTSEWHRTNQDAIRQPQLQPGLSFTGRPQLELGGGFMGTESAGFLARQMAIRGGATADHLDQMRPSARASDAQRMQSLGSLLQNDSAALQQQRRDMLLQQHLATSGLGSQVDAHSRLLLQQHLTGRSMLAGAPTPGTSSSLFHAPAQALLQHSQMNAQMLSQMPGNGGWEIDQLLTRTRNMNPLHQPQAGGRPMGGPPQQEMGALSSDELRYLAELRRRGS